MDFRDFLLSIPGIILTGFTLLGHGIASYVIFVLIGFPAFCAWYLGAYIAVVLAYDRAITYRKKKEDEVCQEEHSYLLVPGVGR